MRGSLSNTVNIFANEIHRMEFKYGHHNKRYEIYEIKYKD